MTLRLVLGEYDNRWTQLAQDLSIGELGVNGFGTWVCLNKPDVQLGNTQVKLLSRSKPLTYKDHPINAVRENNRCEKKCGAFLVLKRVRHCWKG
jgi:hypothetical protein